MPSSSSPSGSPDMHSFIASYGIPLAAGLTAVLGGLSYQLYRWYVVKSQKNERSRDLLARARSAPGELPLARPIYMGGEEQFRSVVRASNLTKELKTVLCRDGVYIGKPEQVVQRLEKMLADGADLFQVVTDFDATLTRYHRDGVRCSSSYGILDSNSMFPSWFREETDRLRKKYYPIELDPALTVEEKTPLMKDWWTKAHDALKQTNLNQSWIPKMVQESSVEMRDRTGVLFAILDHCNIPVLIYSAGIGDLIKEVLTQRCSFKSFAEPPLIVANYMKFSEKGALIGFNDELIHTFNKHEIFPHHLDYFAKHKERTNVLLMGDMTGDLRMADGMSHRENLVTIGFLNSKVHESFALYRDSFDIVLIDDQTQDVPIAIVEAVIKGAPSD